MTLTHLIVGGICLGVIAFTLAYLHHLDRGGK